MRASVLLPIWRRPYRVRESNIPFKNPEPANSRFTKAQMQFLWGLFTSPLKLPKWGRHPFTKNSPSPFEGGCDNPEMKVPFLFAYWVVLLHMHFGRPAAAGAHAQPPQNGSMLPTVVSIEQIVRAHMATAFNRGHIRLYDKWSRRMREKLSPRMTSIAESSYGRFSKSNTSARSCQALVLHHLEPHYMNPCIDVCWCTDDLT